MKRKTFKKTKTINEIYNCCFWRDTIYLIRLMWANSKNTFFQGPSCATLRNLILINLINTAYLIPVSTGDISFNSKNVSCLTSTNGTKSSIYFLILSRVIAKLKSVTIDAWMTIKLITFEFLRSVLRWSEI